MAYSDKVIDHYEHPRNVGNLDQNAPNVGTGIVGAPECGDVMKLQVQVDQATGKISSAAHWILLRSTPACVPRQA